jgi:DNA-binding CsgD family transcriptional regulator/pimeloyl-ACP methyl ester carboxylesterase
MDAPPVQYVKTPDGFDIAYAVSGEGRPVLLMPQPISHIGIEWGSATYGPFLEAMSQRFRLIRYDDRGAGMSTRGLPEDFSFEDHQVDLESVLDELPLYRTVLIGRITAGNVAVKYTLAHPERIEALVLWNSQANYHDSFARSNLELARTHWEHVLATTGRAYFGREDPSISTEMARLSVDRQEFLIRVKANNQLSVEQEAPKLRLPVLVLGSRISGTSLAEQAQRLAAMIPGAQLRVFGGDSGMVGSQADGVPEAVSVIEEFLGSLSDVADGQPTARLTDREREVLRLVAAGKSNRQIAEDLVISSNTVARHLSNVFDKIGAANRAEATAYASRNRLI